MKPLKTFLMIIPGLFIFLTGLIFPVPASSQNPKEIIRKMEDNMRGNAAYMEMSMKTVRPRYTREISMKSWSLGDEYSLILITSPARDEGTAFLKRGNEIWNYVPSIDRTVKMPPSMMSQSWMGSDFTNDDLVRGISAVDDYDHELLGKETIDGKECFKIEMVPHPETPVAYDKILRWISSGAYLPAKEENYNEFGDLVSTIHFREVKNLGGRDFPTIMEMIPHEKEGHKTIITTHQADFNIKLEESFFSKQKMKSVR